MNTFFKFGLENKFEEPGSGFVTVIDNILYNYVEPEFYPKIIKIFEIMLENNYVPKTFPELENSSPDKILSISQVRVKHKIREFKTQKDRTTYLNSTKKLADLLRAAQKKYKDKEKSYAPIKTII